MTQHSHYTTKENKISKSRDINILRFSATLITITKKDQQHKYPLIYFLVYTMQYYSVIQKNKILLLGTTQMELKFIILCEINKT